MKRSLSIKFRNTILSLLIWIMASNVVQSQNQMEPKPNYKEGFIKTNRVNLHYLDWGGNGQPLVLIHGFGDSPYLFAELADSLKKEFRVIAYSKRGHCKSTSIDGNYDNASLVADLKLLLDSLHIEKANLLGWSMAGNDITEFAIRYPGRTNRLIYLEAGYDLSDEAFRIIKEKLPESPLPRLSVLQNLDTYRKWYHSFWFADLDWNPTLEASLIATTQIHPDGRVSTIPNDSLSKMILQEASGYHRDYTKITAKALAIYTNRFFVAPVNAEIIVTRYDELESKIINPWRRNNIQKIKAELKGVIVKELQVGSHTSVIFSGRDAIVKAIRDFMSKN